MPIGRVNVGENITNAKVNEIIDVVNNPVIASGGSAGLTITNDSSSNGTVYPMWTASTSGGTISANVSSARLSFNPASGQLTAGVFNGSHVGNGSGLSGIPNSATTATSANAGGTIVARDGGGGFSAGTITANLNGTATTANTVALSTDASATQFPVLFASGNSIKTNGGGGMFLYQPNTNTLYLANSALAGAYPAATINSVTTAASALWVCNNASVPNTNTNLGLINFCTGGSTAPKGSIMYVASSNSIAYNATSDGNLKNILGPSKLSESVDLLMNTKIREFTWKHDPSNKKQIGVIAQEVYNGGFKGAITVGDEPSRLGQEDYRPWAVDKTAWTFHLIAGFQHLMKENAELKRRLELLESRGI